MKELKIEVPQGYEIDKENSTLECIKFKPLEKQLPMSWEELQKIKGYYVDSYSFISDIEVEKPKPAERNTFPTKEEAEASIALAQLLQLRNAWGGRYYGGESGFCCDIPHYNRREYKTYLLSFNTPELRDKFQETFKDLLEIAKPLL